jgi:tRNA(Ile)-lysidine synthase
LQVLFLLRKEYDIKVGAVHCHHGIRGKEADKDAAFAKEFCAQREIPFYYVEENVEKRAREEKMSVEEAGRQFRYDNFFQLMKQEKYNKLAVAHNANDRAETMLFHLARGTDLAGLSAMEPVRNLWENATLIRPLLGIDRDEIEAWLRKNQLTWRTDQTNLSDQYTRNKIRHHILPKLKEINAQAISHMGKTAQSIGEAVDYLKIQEKQACREILIENSREEEMAMDVGKLKKLHPYLQKVVLYRLLSEFSGGQKDISSVHIDLLKELLEGESGREISLAKQVKARKEYGRLILFRKQKKEMQDWEIRMEKVPYRGQEILKKKYTKFFDCGKIENELCFRFWQPGDYLYLREDGGRKKLNRYFIDEKIPSAQRGQIPVLADGSHIVWVVGYRISAYYKVTEQTEDILSVTIKEKTQE